MATAMATGPSSTGEGVVGKIMPGKRLVSLIAAVWVFSVPAAAQDPLPARREGLWEVVTVTQKPEKVPKISARICVDRASDRDLLDYGLRLSKDTCKRYEIARKGQTWVIESECKMGPVASKSRAQVSGDFQTSVKIRMEGSAEGLPGTSGPQQTLLTQESRWVSAQCEGMKPGDIVINGAVKVNVKQLKQLEKLIPGLIR